MLLFFTEGKEMLLFFRLIPRSLMRDSPFYFEANLLGFLKAAYVSN